MPVPETYSGPASAPNPGPRENSGSIVVRVTSMKDAKAVLPAATFAKSIEASAIASFRDTPKTPSTNLILRPRCGFCARFSRKNHDETMVFGPSNLVPRSHSSARTSPCRLCNYESGKIRARDWSNWDAARCPRSARSATLKPGSRARSQARSCRARSRGC
jgi:hypothetical protein